MTSTKTAPALSRLPAFAAWLIGLGLVGAMSAHAATNKPGPRLISPSANPVSDLVVTGEQIIDAAQTCTKVTITITGKVEGVSDDDGQGNDNVVFELWDDSQLKASQTINIPVGATQDIQVILQFAGLYQTGAAGVGVYASEIGLLYDPFIPVDVTGSCYDKPVAISGVVRNLRQATVTCTNRTTGQQIQSAAPRFDCTAAGMTHTARDKVQITINGSVR